MNITNEKLRIGACLALATLASQAARSQVTATFNPATGVLRVIGDAAPNQITVSDNGAGTILVNGGAILAVGGVPTRWNTTLIQVNGWAGNDVITLDDPNGTLPPGELDGGDGNDQLNGGRAADTLRGGYGNDTLVGGRGNDTMLGEDGDDLLIWNNGDGSDLFEGGNGNDIAQVNGSNTAGDDFSIAPNGQRVRFDRNNLGPFTLDIGTCETMDVNGQGGDDVIAGQNGLSGLIELDLDGGDGNDLITGGNGPDVLRGGAGNDTLVGARGNDTVLGEDGDDLMIWNNGDGSDVNEGGNGNDTTQVNGSDTAGDAFAIAPNGQRVLFQRTNFGPFSVDIGTTETLDVNGQGGDDVITGATGLANLIALDLDGGSDSDTLTGGDGIDTLRGGDGNDTLIGARGNDVMLGGDGDDLLIWNNGDGSDLFEGGAGDDIAQVNGSNTAGDDFSITPNGQRVLFQRTNLGPFTLDIGTCETLDVNGQGGDDAISGSPGLTGLIELDLDGGDGNDVLVGGDGADTLRGGAGNDTIFGAKGNDTMLGEDGNDLMIWNNGDGSDVFEGGAGFDVGQVNGSDSAGDDFDIRPNGTRVAFRRNNLGPFSIDVGTTENLDVNGQGGDDRIAASTGLAALIFLDLDGGAGNDLLIGGDGWDILRGGAGDDILIGNDGTDIIVGEDGNDLISGGNGNDYLSAGNGNDVVLGDAGNDTLWGDAGDDVLIGGLGYDFADGGAGYDVAITCENVINVP